MKLSRRTVLRGAGISIALPWLEAMGERTSKAQAAAPPKRAIFMFSPNGYIQEQWVPTGTETSFTFPADGTLKPLEPHIKDIIILDGVANVAANSGPGDGHERGMGSMLTGTQLSGTGGKVGLGGGISVDQEMVNKLMPPTKLPSLELGVQSRQAGTVWGYSSYKGSAMGLPPENSPAKVFTRLFADFTGGGAATTSTTPDASLMRTAMDRKSVLDTAMRNFTTLNAKLGSTDRAKLQDHFDAIRELEKRVTTTPSAGGGGMASAMCAKPVAPVDGDFLGSGRQQMDLLAMAIACDLTRVSTLQWSNSFGDARPLADITTGHHTISHDSNRKPELARIDGFYAEQFAYLVAKLKAIPEGSGTALDNTVILWSNEVSKGWVHDHVAMPFVMAGRAGGKLRTGRFLKFTGSVPHNNLLVSILNLMDVPATTFGNPKNCTGPLAGLV
ncbi:MAG: DUF1552 domain-containing protein [Myxococcales bacterium]